LDIFDGYIIDQSKARVGSECTLNAINPNASKKPHTYKYYENKRARNRAVKLPYVVD
jgi:hypothetical protein